MDEGATNAISKTNLFGPGLSGTQTQNLTDHYSIEKHVGKNFPPTFLFHTEDDAVVSVENAFRMDDALTAAGVRT
jgi:dipeptidyl aminopeptidase/acylaminoacyl peptidase